MLLLLFLAVALLRFFVVGSRPRLLPLRLALPSVAGSLLLHEGLSLRLVGLLVVLLLLLLERLVLRNFVLLVVPPVAVDFPLPAQNPFCFRIVAREMPLRTFLALL